MKYCLCTGNPRDGFRYVGPFNKDEDCLAYAEYTMGLDPDWWMVEIETPQLINIDEVMEKLIGVPMAPFDWESEDTLGPISAEKKQ